MTVGTPFDSESAREAQAKSVESRLRKREEAEEQAREALAASLSVALERHIALLDAESEQVKLRAIETLYERLLGRAPQHHELSGAGGGPVEIVVESCFSDVDDGAEVAPSDDQDIVSA